MRAAICPPVNVSTVASDASRLASSARTTPSSVWSSSARMKFPSRLRTSRSTGPSFARTSSTSLPRTVSLVSSCG